MEVIVILAAVLLVAILKSMLINKHGKRLGMRKKRSPMRKDRT